jgi:hypothetical protein
MMWMMTVIIMDCMPVVVIKGKGDWRRRRIRTTSMPVIVDNAPLKNESRQE